MPFHAHQVLEDAWKTAPEASRALWKCQREPAHGIDIAGLLRWARDHAALETGAD